MTKFTGPFPAKNPDFYTEPAIVETTIGFVGHFNTSIIKYFRKGKKSALDSCG
jgi:hypothetical protein